MRDTAIVVVLLLGLTCTAFAQGEIFSDDFESGLPFAWSSLSAWMPSVEIEPDFAGLISQYVKPEDGATITAVGSDGTEYRLTIPPNALIKPAVIIMIPIAAIPNLPLTDGLGAGSSSSRTASHSSGRSPSRSPPPQAPCRTPPSASPSRRTAPDFISTLTPRRTAP